MSMKEIIKKCLDIMNLEQRIELYEYFNGGTYSDLEFNEWMEDII